ncbi:MAG: Rv2175c family DNA-binding protein [Pseudonocardiaceae bacterium]
MSDIPTAPDVLDPEVAVLPLPDVAQRLGQPVTRVHQMLRDGQLLALRRGGVVVVPADFLGEAEPTTVVKGLPGTVTLLRDAGYADEEILRWLFTADESLPGCPIEALRSNRGREVKRRAQAMGF